MQYTGFTPINFPNESIHYYHYETAFKPIYTELCSCQ